MIAFFSLMQFLSQSGSISFTVLPLVSTLPHNTSFITSLLSETIRSLSLCQEAGSGRLHYCVHMLQLWFCSHMSLFPRVEPVRFLRKNRVKITVAIDLHLMRDTTAWLGYMFGLGPTNWVWRVKWGVTRWQGWLSASVCLASC